VSKCHRTRRLMGPYLYGDLRGKELRFVEGHLAICSECRAEVAAAESAVAQVPRTALRPSDDARSRILAGVDRRATEFLTARQSRPGFGWLRTWGLAAAALVLGLFVGYHLPRDLTPPPGRDHPVAVSSPIATSMPPSADVSAGSQSPGATASASADAEEGMDSAPGGAGPTMRQTASTERPRSTERRPREVAIQAKPVLRPPRPLGIDDVQVAEAVRLEVVR